MLPDGSGTVYSKLIGGNVGQTGGGSGVNYALGIAVSSNGSAYLAGGTDAKDFPKTFGPSIAGSRDAWAGKLNPDGSVAFARLLGGSDYDEADGVALRPACVEPCNPYIVGFTYSRDFSPISNNAVQTSLTNELFADFVEELSADGTSALYSTYLGAPNDFPVSDEVNGIAIDATGDAYVISESYALNNFPLASQIYGPPPPNGGMFNYAEVTGATPTPTPASQLNWPSSNGSALTIKNANNGTTYVGTSTGLVTSADGINFSLATPAGLPTGSICAIDLPDLNPQPVLAGCSGLYISTDNGNTFNPSGLTNQTIGAIADIPGTALSDTKMLVGTHNGAWASSDGGATFSQIASIPANTTVLAIRGNGHDGSVVPLGFMGTMRGVYSSSDVGTNFPRTWTPTNLTSPSIIAIERDGSSPTVDYAAGISGGFYESTDGFNTFLGVNIPLFDYDVLSLAYDGSTTPERFSQVLPACSKPAFTKTPVVTTLYLLQRT